MKIIFFNLYQCQNLWKDRPLLFGSFCKNQDKSQPQGSLSLDPLLCYVNTESSEDKRYIDSANITISLTLLYPISLSLVVNMAKQLAKMRTGKDLKERRFASWA